jgi:hydroxymethylpyrimidine pyrophosphatase-like HAD family hydrolase
MRDYEIYAVDFDGTLVEDKFPDIGEPKLKVIDYCKQVRQSGHKLILWTCRTGSDLDAAVKWCNEHGLFFHAVNANLPEEIEYFGNDCRKVGADFFLDDRSINLSDIEEGLI